MAKQPRQIQSFQRDMNLGHASVPAINSDGSASDLTPPGGTDAKFDPFSTAHDKNGVPDVQAEPITATGERGGGGYEYSMKAKPGTPAETLGKSHEQMMSEADDRAITETQRKFGPGSISRGIGGAKSTLPQAQKFYESQRGQHQDEVEGQFDRTAQFRSKGADGVNYGGNEYNLDEEEPNTADDRTRERLNVAELAATATPTRALPGDKQGPSPTDSAPIAANKRRGNPSNEEQAN